MLVSHIDTPLFGGLFLYLVEILTAMTVLTDNEKISSLSLQVSFLPNPWQSFLTFEVNGKGNECLTGGLQSIAISGQVTRKSFQYYLPR